MRSLARILLWMAVAGFPVKLAKASGGKSVEWIGACVSFRDEERAVTISIPPDKMEKLQSVCKQFVAKPVVGARQLRSFAGGLSFVAGLVPHLRPFLSTIWAALGKSGSASDESRKRFGKLIHTRRFRQALTWIMALLGEDVAPLMRTFHAMHRPMDAQIITDACPFGIGGVLMREGQPAEFFASTIPENALARFQAEAGNSKWNTVWEGLALLVAFRLWLPLLGFGATCLAKSDNMGVICMLAKGRAKSADLNILAREFALDQALQVYRIHWLQHIPGIANKDADALSRLEAPIPEPFPQHLANARRRAVRVDTDFWRVPVL